MSNKPKLIYWDSNVFVSAIQQTAGRYPTLKAILDYAASDKALIITSALTIAEVVKINPETEEWTEEETERWKASADKIDAFFENDYFVIQNVDRRISEKARDIVRQYNIKPPDAIHIATALSSHSECLQTYDKKHMLRFDGKIGWPPLSIKKPSHPEGKSAPTLFD